MPLLNAELLSSSLVLLGHSGSLIRNISPSPLEVEQDIRCQNSRINFVVYPGALIFYFTLPAEKLSLEDSSYRRI